MIAEALNAAEDTASGVLMRRSSTDQERDLARTILRLIQVIRHLRDERDA